MIKAVGVDLYNQTVTGAVSKSMTSAATDSDHVPCVLVSRTQTLTEDMMKTYSEKRFFHWVEDEKSVTLRAKSGSYGGGSEVLVTGGESLIEKAVGIGNGQTNQFSMKEVANTLDAMHDTQKVMTMQGFGDYKECGVSSTCKGRDSKSANDLVIDRGKKPRRSVRRLTPKECERLQGLPDDWTSIGEWTDTEGKKHREADAPRYKALGNSIALPFWFYLLRRISAQYERPATLGSLFDGIGGFPLCWERCNGKGTAVWASEIEEFPIAVTKKHFPEDDE